MNLEDRLRSHMHSAEDLFAESDRDVGAITSAGRRRTRRNQIGGAAAGGVLALGIVFGVASNFSGSDADEEVFAQAETEVAATDEAAGDITESAMAPMDDSIESQLAPEGFVPIFEVITSVGDGFAGLRSSAAGIEFIESDDGESWSVTPTTGIPEGAEINSITAGDGFFAAPFHVFDPATATSTAHIGTSADGSAWMVSGFDLAEDLTDPFLPEVVISGGDVVGVVMAWPFFDEASAASGDASVYTIRGPVGGPFEATPIPATGFGIGDLASTDSVVMFNLFHDGGSRLWASSNGGDWGVVREFGFDDFASLGGTRSEIILASATEVESSADAGVTWSVEALPISPDANNSSSVLASGSETAAVLISRTSADGNLDGHKLVALIDGEWREVLLDTSVPDSAFVSLVAVSEDEALLEIFPIVDELDEDLAASGGLVEVPGPVDAPVDTEDHDHDHELDSPQALPTYVRVPLT